MWWNIDGDKSTLLQVMACCHQATSHFLKQCWASFISPYGVTRPKWVNPYQCVPSLQSDNKSVSQIPQCTSPISHNAPLVHMYAHFCYTVVHCGTFAWCLVGFVRWLYECSDSPSLWTSRWCPRKQNCRLLDENLIKMATLPFQCHCEKGRWLVYTYNSKSSSF